MASKNRKASSKKRKARSPQRLKVFLKEVQAESFQNALDALPPWSRNVLGDTLANLTNSRWNRLIGKMSFASPERLAHYTNILGAYFPQPPRGRQVKKTDQDLHKATGTPAPPSGDELRSRFRRLPLELRHKIEYHFIQSSLAQDYVFPHQQPGPNGLHIFQGKFFEPTKYEVLLGLNKASYECYTPQFWDSYFVIGPGSAADSMQWLERMPPNVRNRVQKVHISLDTIDLPFDQKSGVEFRTWERYQREKVIDDDPVRLLEEYDRETSLYELQRRDLWKYKLGLLAKLNLKTLVVDIRNAGSIDGYRLAYWSKSHSQVKVLGDDDYVWDSSTCDILDYIRLVKPGRY